MGTLLNALRRMQKERGSISVEPRQQVSTSEVDSSTRIDESTASHPDMNPPIVNTAAIPDRLHGSRAPTERLQVFPGYTGLARGAMDERVDETLATVDSLLASALAARDEIQEYTSSPADIPSPTQRIAGFAERMLEIASDGSIGMPECPTEILAQAANWQSTLDMIDKELQQCDGHDSVCLLRDFPPEELLDVDTPHETNILPAASQADPVPQHVEPVATELESPTHQLVVAQPIESESTLLACADTARQQQQFDNALDYAAHVVSETKHLTMDLLDSLPARSDDADTLTYVADESPETVDDNPQVNSWEQEPSGLELQHEWSAQGQEGVPDLADLEHAIDWGDDDGNEEPVDADCSTTPEPQAASASDLESPAERDAQDAARAMSCTAFEQELAIRMANVRYLEQCRKVANRMRQDLADGPSGRAVALIGCEVDVDLSDVTAAIGFVFSQSFHAKVLMVDGQFSRQLLSRHYHLSGSPGLSEACKSMNRWNHLVQPTYHENLFLLPAGSRLDRGHPTEDILRELVQRMRDRFDLVIVDIGEPSSPMSCPCLAAADAAYLVVQLGRTNRSLALGTIASLKERHRTLNGCIVMNSMNA